MPKFEVISIEEAKEATKEADWLERMYGEEFDVDFGECNCDPSCNKPATVAHPVLEKVMVCSDCFEGLEAAFNDDAVMHYHAGAVISVEKNNNVR